MADPLPSENQESALFLTADPTSPDGDRVEENWPVALTSLVGRRNEVEQIVALLGGSAVRLVTLTGPGGVGKTRLAIRVGEATRETLPDRVLFVSLASIVDPALVPAIVAQAFDVREAIDQSLIDRLRQTLRSWSGMLILDNFEQVATAAPFVADLLMTCPSLKVLVTSRTVLHVSGEHEYVVPPLTPPALSSTVAEVAANDAVVLFVQRAQAVRASFALGPENVAAVVEICRRLDGLPLAIELAAARSKVLSPAALLARLSHRFQVLTSGPQDQPSRLQTMRAAIAWSHDLLTEEEQILFRRLAVFVGGFTLDAAEAVGGPLATVDGVASLLDKSLLRSGDGREDEPRFAMLETIREFGLECLEDAGEADAIRESHAAWCRQLVEECWNAWVRRTDIERTIQRLEYEHDNLRASLSDLKRTRDAEGILCLGGGLFWFWYIRGYLREGRDWLVPALEQTDGEATVSRGRALLGAGTLAHYLGDQTRAEPLLRTGLDDARAIRDPWLTAFALLLLGIAEEHQGRYEQAKPLFDEMVTVTRASGDRIAHAQALSHRGLVGWAMGEGDAAEALLHEALRIQREAGDTWGVGDSLDLLGLITSERGDTSRAMTYVEESLTRRLAMGASKCVPWSLEIVGLLASSSKRPAEAARLYGGAAALRERIGSAPHDPEKSAYDRAIARSRTAMGDADFTAAWESGRTRPIEASMAEAREVMASLQTPKTSVRQVPATNSFGLTEREIEVLGLIVTGLSDREIGEALFISPRTAQKHAATIFDKLGVNSRTSAATAAIRAGIVSSGETPR